MSTVDNERPPYVAFEYRPVEDRSQTISSGVYSTKNVAYAMITRAGSRDTHEVVAEEWLEKLSRDAKAQLIPLAWVQHFRGLYAAWKDGETLPEAGIPIKGWSLISPAEQQNIIKAGYKTVEDLAHAPDGGLATIGMGAISYKQKAVAWLAEAKEKGSVAARFDELMQKLDALAKANETLQAENKALQAQLPKVKVA